MATHALDRPEIKTAPRRTIGSVVQKIGQVARHPGKSFRSYFGYADGKLWAPYRDVEDPHMRRFALALGKIARATTNTSDRLRSPSEMMHATLAGEVDMTIYSHARRKLANALLADSLSGNTAPYPRGNQVPLRKDPRFANIPIDQENDFIYSAIDILGIMAESRFGVNVNLDDDTTRAAFGHELHNRKLKRHNPEPAPIPDEERVPFEQLSESAQDAEMRQVRIAQNLFRTGYPGLQESLQRVLFTK
ncbi:MAG TPA: hypothetical protein VLF40_02790 [Candidatus Saccharimonadales bacterium]|nr:hypothetical protein [Candidatus Saccharimonadales bacterium]